MNKRITQALAGILLAATQANVASAQVASTAISADPAELTEARAIMDIAYPSHERQQTFDTLLEQLLDQFRQSLPDDAITDPGLRAIMEKYFDGVPERVGPLLHAHLPKIIDATAVAYTNAFSLDELIEIRRFGETETGGRFLRESIELMGDPAVAAANTAYFTELQRLQQAMNAELREEVVSYLNAQPEDASSPSTGRAK